MMKYEKPLVEVIDFSAENIMTDGGGIGEAPPSFADGNEPL